MLSKHCGSKLKSAWADAISHEFTLMFKQGVTLAFSGSYWWSQGWCFAPVGVSGSKASYASLEALVPSGKASLTMECEVWFGEREES